MKEQEFQTLVPIKNLEQLNQVRNQLTKVFGLTIDEYSEENNEYVESFEEYHENSDVLYAVIFSSEKEFKDTKTVELVCSLDTDVEEEDLMDIVTLKNFLNQKDIEWTTGSEPIKLKDTVLGKVFQTLVPCKTQEQFEKIIEHIKELGIRPVEDEDYNFEECVNYIENGNDEDNDFYDPEETTYVLIYASDEDYFRKRMVNIAVTSTSDLEEEEEDETAVGYFEFLKNDSLDWY